MKTSWSKQTIIPNGYVTKKELWSFGIGGMGQNMIYGIMSSFLLFFYTDVVGLASAVAGAIITIARVWDAINDPIMGGIVDRSKSKMGKFKPFLLATPALMALSTILLYVSPEFGMGGKIAYAAITYISWGMIYTVSDIPFWGLSAAVSPLPEERKKFLDFARIVCSIGAVITMGAGPFLLSMFGGDRSSKAYLILAVIFGLLGGALFLLVGLNVKDKIKPKKDAHVISLKENIHLLIKNKPLMLVFIAGIISSGRTLAQVAATYIATYNFQSTVFLGMSGLELFIVLGAGFGVGMFAGMFLMPVLQKIWDLRQIFIYTSLLAFAVQLVMFFIGYGNILVVTGFLFIAGLPFGCYNVLTYAMISDCVEYNDWKTGQRSEGFSFSLQTFMTKLGAGIATAITAAILALSGFIAPNADASLGTTVGEAVLSAGEMKWTFAQSVSTLNWLYALLTIIPAISCLLSIIPIIKYPLSAEKMKEVYADMAVRRAQAETAAEATETQCEIKA